MTTRGQAFVAAGITLAVAGIFLGLPDLVRIGGLLTVMPLAARALLRSRGDTLVVTRTCSPARPRVDEPGTITVDIRNAGRRASAMQVASERLSPPLAEGPRFVLGSMTPGEVRRVSYPVRVPLRGRHRLGPLEITATDPFGLTRRTRILGGTDDILVLPAVEPLGEDRPPGLGVGNDGEASLVISLAGEDDASIREYRQGDSLRRIHWPSTARTGELMVRQEDRPARRRATIVLDRRAEAFQGQGAGHGFEWAVRAAASIFAHLHRLGYASHLVCGSRDAAGVATVAVDTDAAVEELALVAPRAHLPLAELAAEALPVTSSGGVLVAILGDHGGVGLDRLAALRPAGGVAMALIVTSSSPASPESPVGTASLALAEALNAAGWTTHIAGTDDDVPSAWHTLRHLAAAGVR